MTETTPPKKSDLGVRAASAMVMIAVAGTALWLGGWVWTAFVALVGCVALWEWLALVRRFAPNLAGNAVWTIFGILYIGVACAMALALRNLIGGPLDALQILAVVVATDVGAYFAGRTIGGPKIAPAISPSKTWAGLFGGMIGAGLTMLAFMPWTFHDFDPNYWFALGALPAAGGMVAAVVAQAGDFLESWMKRRAGVKDSSSLIPGHGGVMDRVDGLLAVLFALAVFLFVGSIV